MDGLSTAASISAVIQITCQAYSLCQTYYLEVKKARKDINVLCKEIIAFQDVLRSVRDMASTHGPGTLSNLHVLCNADGLVAKCQKEMEELVSGLWSGFGKSEKMKQFGVRALKWPFRSKDIEKALIRIERYKTTLNLALTADQM